MAWEEPRRTGMQYRRLGNSGLHVSALGLGGWLTYVQLSVHLHTHTDRQAVSVAMLRMVISIFTLISHSTDHNLRTYILHHEDRI